MTTNLALEGTIDKILKNTENSILSSLKISLDDSKHNLDDSVTKLESEYDKIISDGKKEADKLEKQIVGGSDIEARNKQLLALEAAVNRVFTTALEQITNSARNSEYANLIKSLLEESTKILGTTQVKVFTNAKDKDVVKSSLSNFAGSELSSKTIDCIGGVKIESKDGAMKFDNTIDAKIDRLKPLIRKEIASKFGVKQ
ncbi:MAG: V-type ATP synthase subunit E family protein [Candidatus Nitrosopumilus limneticus]|nr:C subunit E [Candidatus Nitrosopumilus limneticus]MDC4212084.1 V-type ATP synthase subunit E family protein [Candidatus Nitrosopumilus limneticus]MDC4214527.1 V-type ATP synthase subunit E family protein [Candidatus Nitrosopumilus limneticus]MDC4216101.1 V-type ATP synthase subunit E family protein [Candidatus Nitrosopumilus limneticus]MDC4219749.1 V-type ATP synthase subunit E family protein [Candidatus Nitrosopumilus limneticus]